MTLCFCHAIFKQCTYSIIAIHLTEVIYIKSATASLLLISGIKYLVPGN